MRRAVKWLGLDLAGLVGIPLLLVACRAGGGQHRAGQRAIESLTPKLTGDTVRIAGLSGRFPGRAASCPCRVARSRTATTRRSTALVLDWSPLELLHRLIVIDRLAADDVDVMRMPASSSSGGSIQPASAGDPARTEVGRVDIGAPMAGTGSDCA